MNDNLILIKIGGSVLTDKTKPFSINEEIINSISSQISKFKNLKIIIVHGGGSFGHPLAKKYELNKGLKKTTKIIGISETHNAMLKLNKKIIEIFLNKNVPVISLSPLDIFLTTNGRITNSFLEPIKKSLENGLIPVLFGDTVYDLSKGIAILSGDQIITYLGIKLKAKKIILATDIDGLYSADPKNNSDAIFIEEINPNNFEKIRKYFSSSNKTAMIDVTGGMFGKLIELIEAAKKGIEVCIINAKNTNNIEKVLKGEKITCTKFKDWENFS